MNKSQVYQKASRALNSLANEAESRISKIIKREYGSSVIDDLNMNEFSDFFNATIDYFRGSLFDSGELFNLKEQFKLLYEFNFDKLIKERHKNIRIFDWSIYNVFGSQSKFVDRLLEMLKALKGEIENILYWITIQ
jgi:hypothetical protein